jgi:hypothetical protein
MAHYRMSELDGEEVTAACLSRACSGAVLLVLIVD